MLEQVLSEIGRRERFVVTSHARPDGDAVGSALAGCEILRQMGKHADIVLRDGVPRVYLQLPFTDRVTHADIVEGDYDAAILLECDNIQRTRGEWRCPKATHPRRAPSGF
jgi:phosphoesterase RecJ-like protein